MRWRGEASRAVWETCDVEDCKEPPDSHDGADGWHLQMMVDACVQQQHECVII